MSCVWTNRGYFFSVPLSYSTLFFFSSSPDPWRSLSGDRGGNRILPRLNVFFFQRWQSSFPWSTMFFFGWLSPCFPRHYYKTDRPTTCQCISDLIQLNQLRGCSSNRIIIRFLIFFEPSSVPNVTVMNIMVFRFQNHHVRKFHRVRDCHQCHNFEGK